MRIFADQIANGSYDGKYVWVCDYRFTNMNEKPIRHVAPQKVFVRSNTETPKRFYYSESHFVALNTKGGLTTKIITLYDNTGFRSFPGVDLSVFENEEECRVCYRDQCKEILANLEIWHDQNEIRYQDLKTSLISA